MEISWNCATQVSWQKNLPIHACALQQSWAYGAVIASMNGQVERAEISLNGTRIGCAQIVTKQMLRFGTVGLISRGPIWANDIDPQIRRKAMSHLRRDLPGKGIRVLISTPEENQPGILPLYTACHVAELALTKNISQLRTGLHGKWRTALEKAKRSNLRISVSQDPDVLVALIDKETTQQRQKRYRNLPPRFLANWVRNAPNAFQVYRAFMGTEPVAEMLFLDHAPGVTYQIGWSSGAGRTLQAHNLLMWRALKDYAALGRKRLDLGTLDTVNAQGLARFKLGTGAIARELGPTGLFLPRVSSFQSHYAARTTSTGTAL